MTDNDDRLEVRIRAAFGSEQRRAESDLQSEPIRPRVRGRRHRALAVFAMAALVVVVVAATSVLIHETRPATGGGATGSPAASALPVRTASPDRYSDGIPRTFDGQPVLRWSDAVTKAGATTDATPFFVAAWLNVYDGPMDCPAMPVDPSAPDSWVSSICTGVTASADAGATPVTLDSIATFHFADFKKLNTGPAILRVHTHDPHSSECGPEQAVCERMIVVDGPVWTGDSETDPQPFTVADVIAAAGSVSPPTALEIQTTADLGYDQSLQGALALSRVSPAEGMPADMQIGGAYLMPDDAAMKRALPNVQPGSAGAMLQSAWKSTGSGSGPGYSFTVDNRWLVVDNVAFSVNTASPPTATDEAWLADLEAALRATR
jgi:hypothetical protein